MTGWAKIEYGIIERIAEIGVTPFAVLCALARHVGDADECWPSNARLAEIVGCTTRTIQTSIRTLERAALVETVFEGGPSRQPNRYRLTGLPRVKPVSPIKGEADFMHEASFRRRVKLASPEQDTKNKKQIDTTRVKPVSPIQSLSSDLLVEKWNALPGIRRCQKMTAARLRAFKARLKEAGWVDQVDAALERVAASPFLTGENDRGWKADIDFFLRPDSMTKIMEGKYDGRSNGKPANSSFRVPPGKPYVFKASDSP